MHLDTNSVDQIFVILSVNEDQYIYKKLAYLMIWKVKNLHQEKKHQK